MKRPFAYLGFSCLLGLLVAFFTSVKVLFGIVTVLFLLLIFLLVKKVKNAELKLSIVGMIMACISMTFLLPTLNYEFNDTYKAKIKVISYTAESEYDFSCTGKIQSINDKEIQPLKATIYLTDELDLSYGDIIEGNFKIMPVENGSGFDYYNSLKADGYKVKVLGLFNEEYSISAIENISFLDRIFIFKEEVKTSITKIFEENTQKLLCAMLLGEKEAVPDEVYSDFIDCGVSHVLVVSGMHLSIICGVLLFIFTKIYLKRELIYIFIIPTIVVYVLLTGLGLSVIRSAIMFGVIALTDIVGEEADGLNSLGLATLFITFLNPYSAVDIGFLLSVSATAGIIILSKPIHKRLQKKIPKQFRRCTYSPFLVIAVSISAFVFTMPVLLYAMGTINPMSIICSAVLAFPVSAFMLLSIFTIIFSYIPFMKIIVDFMAVIINLIADFMIWFCDKFAVIGDNLVVFQREQAIVIFSGLTIILGVFLLFKATKKVKVVTISMSILVLVSGYASAIYHSYIPKLLVLDGGKGCFSALVVGNDAVVLTMDSNNESAAKYLLDDYNVKNIKYLFVEEGKIAPMKSKIYANYKIDNTVNFTKHNDDIEVFEDIWVNYSVGGEFLEICIDDKVLIVDNIGITSTEIDCDVCVLYGEKTKVNSDIILTGLEREAVENSGKYLFMDKSEYVVTFGKKITIRGLS